MIRFLLLLLLVGVTWGGWIVKERPGLILDIALHEWGTLKTWLTPTQPSKEPETSSPLLPLIAENRTASTVFQPRLREFAPRLSVPTAHAAVIVDAETGQELFARDAHAKRPVASLTKLFTALIVVETIPDLETLVTIDGEAVYADGTRIGCPRSGFCNSPRLQIGEQITVRNLLKAALMNSANDAAIALAKHIDGTQDAFVERMNRRAQELGLSDSNFCTPSGLEIEGREGTCYSTAADMAKIAATSLRYAILWDIMQLKETTVSSHDGALLHELFNTNQLLGNMPNLLGTKTGFTPLAGYSLLAVAYHPDGGHPVVAVILNDPYRWETIRSMFSWSFQAYDWI